MFHFFWLVDASQFICYMKRSTACPPACPPDIWCMGRSIRYYSHMTSLSISVNKKRKISVVLFCNAYAMLLVNGLISSATIYTGVVYSTSDTVIWNVKLHTTMYVVDVHEGHDELWCSRGIWRSLSEMFTKTSSWKLHKK